MSQLFHAILRNEVKQASIKKHNIQKHKFSQMISVGVLRIGSIILDRTAQQISALEEVWSSICLSCEENIQ